MFLVVAYGNPLRQDDGVGWRVASGLDGRPGTAVYYVHQLVPELASSLCRAEGVLFLDAAVGEEPGRVVVRDVAAAPEDAAFGHVLRPAGLLDLARRLVGEAPPARLLTVTVNELGFGPDLSPAVEAALPAAIGAARSALEALARRKPCGGTAAKG